MTRTRCESYTYRLGLFTLFAASTPTGIGCRALACITTDCSSSSSSCIDRGEVCRVSCLRGLSPGMASAGARAYNGGLGAETPAGSRGRAHCQGVRGRSPPEAKNLLVSGCATEAANLPHSLRTLTLSK